MTTNRDRCPTPADLERLYWIARENLQLQVRDAEMHEHVARCENCSNAWSEISELSELGQTIEPSATWERREEIRTTLLCKSDHDRAPARPPVFEWRRLWLAPIAAAAAAIALWLAWPSGTSHPDPIARRANVLKHEGARSIVVTEQPDEIVRLVDGTITVSVATLGANERFRVIAGDDELSADDAAFDVTAAGDHIVAVRVIHGNVRLLAAGTPKDLRAGETWHSSMTAMADSAPPVASAPVASAPVASAPVASAPVTSAPVTSAPVASAPVTSAPALVATSSPSPPRATIVRTPVRAPRETRTPVGVQPETAEPVESPIEAPQPPVAPPMRTRSAAQVAFDEAWVALRAGEFRKAASSFERTVTMSNDAQVIEDSTFWRGVALARGGEVATAVHVLTAFVQAYPGSPRLGEASVMLGWMLFERGDREEAKSRFDVGTRDRSPRVRESAAAGLAAIAKR